MRRVCDVEQFWFKGIDRFQMADMVAKECTISLNQDLVDRVYSRYPFIDKTTTALIIKSFFEVIRRLVIVGETIYIDKLTNAMRLIFFLKNGTKAAMNVSVITPSCLWSENGSE